jgi:hypothetical protein
VANRYGPLETHNCPKLPLTLGATIKVHFYDQENYFEQDKVIIITLTGGFGLFSQINIRLI